MIPQFTETLEDYINNGGEVYQNLFSKFPKFNLFEDGTELDMFTLFRDKYDIREIGAESEELFGHFLREKIQELLIKYVPKINMFLDNFNELFKFSVKLDLDYKESYSNGGQNTYYLNPANSNLGITKVVKEDGSVEFGASRMKVENVDNTDNAGKRERNISRDVLQSVWGKTRADILEKIMDLKSIYYDCLSEFETIFMGLY